MKGYTIQHSIELLEEEVKNGGGSGGPTTAANVSYDNTTSQLTADDVQEAIDEVVGMIGAIPVYTGVEYSETEAKIGKWIDGADLYQKTISCGALPNTTDKVVPHLITGIDKILGIEGIAVNTTSGAAVQLGFATTVTASNYAVWCDKTNITLRTAGNAAAYDACYVTLRYTKTPAETNTRKKKKEDK